MIHEPGDTIVMGPLMAGVYAAGRLMRSRSELASALERDRAEGEHRAVLEERARIARELHDVVAHAISVMTVQAGAERLAIGSERPQTTEALSQIERTGRQALAEMRRLLGMLRDPGEAVDMTPPSRGWASCQRSPSGSRGRGSRSSSASMVRPAPCRPAWTSRPTGSSRRG